VFNIKINVITIILGTGFRVSCILALDINVYNFRHFGCSQFVHKIGENYAPFRFHLTLS